MKTWREFYYCLDKRNTDCKRDSCEFASTVQNELLKFVESGQH